jgi:hypothetical protein
MVKHTFTAPRPPSGPHPTPAGRCRPCPYGPLSLRATPLCLESVCSPPSRSSPSQAALSRPPASGTHAPWSRVPPHVYEPPEHRRSNVGPASPSPRVTLARITLEPSTSTQPPDLLSERGDPFHLSPEHALEQRHFVLQRAPALGPCRTPLMAARTPSASTVEMYPGTPPGQRPGRSPRPSAPCGGTRGPGPGRIAVRQRGP